MTKEELTAFLETLPLPDGYDWAVVNYTQYRSCQVAELPTFYGEYSYAGGEPAMVYLAGQHELAGVPRP